MSVTENDSNHAYTVFHGSRRIGQGPLPEVAKAVRRALELERDAGILVFDDASGRVVDLDLRNFPPEATRGPGRPRLGVVPREVTLLPRHWDWLNRQPGGASVALRKLVEQARRTHAGEDRQRSSREAAYKFLLAMAGDEPGYEEALRALFQGNRKRFESLIGSWPGDIPEYALTLAGDAFHDK